MTRKSKRNVSPDQVQQLSNPQWYESNLLWTSGTFAIGVIITVIASMKSDLRGLLWLAFPFGCISVYAVCKNIASCKIKYTCLSLGIFIVGLFLYLLNSYIQPTALAQPQKDQPSLLARYLPTAVPFYVDPNSTIYVLQLNPNITNWLLEVSNTTKEIKRWPEDLRKDVYKDDAFVCYLTNYTDKTLLNVSGIFPVNFYELKDIEIKVTRKKDGTTQMEGVPGPPGSGAMLFIEWGPGGFGGIVKRSFTQGKIVTSFNREVFIPAISPKQTITIYLVNQSQFIAGFDFPYKAKAVRADNSQEIEVSLVRPPVTVMDSGTSFALRPATYPWKSVSDGKVYPTPFK